jgi:hypothetical protein
MEHLQNFNENQNSDEEQKRNKAIIKKLQGLVDGSEFITLIVDEGVKRIEDGANPDKVYQWFYELKNTFNRNMVTSPRELAKRQQSMERKAQKGEKKAQLLSEMKSLEQEMGLKAYGYFDWKTADESYMEMAEKTLNGKGLYLTWEGDGYESFFITDKELTKSSIMKFRKMRGSIEDNLSLDYENLGTGVVIIANDKTALQKFLDSLD